MKRAASFPLHRLAVFFVMLSLLVLPGTADPQQADYQKALALISEKLHQRYPHLEGVVVAVKGGDLYLGLGTNEKVTKGVKLSVFRRGAPFRHPITGQVLGSLEEEIGEAEVVEVRDKFSIARMIRLTPGRDLVPRVKDIVRLSSSKIQLSVLPFVNQTKEAFGTETLTRELARVLLAQGRFDVFDVDQLQVWLLENGIAVDEILKGENAIRLRNKTRADLALENTIREVRGKKVITSRLLSLTTRKELFQAVAIADELPFEQGAPKHQALRRGGGGRQASAANPSFVLDRQGVPGVRGGVSNYVFNDMTLRGVAVADVDKDGKNEVLLLTAHELIVYQVSQSRMREVARFNEGVGNDFRWIDVADMDGDGRPEIYLANYRFDSLMSMVIELRGREFVKIVERDPVFYRLLRVRRPPRGTKIPDRDALLLLGQNQGLSEPFEGPIQRYRWAGKKLRAVAPYVVPSGLTILGFGLWDIDKDGSLDVIEVGKDDRIRIYSRRGEVRYTGAGRYGGPVHTFYSAGDDVGVGDRRALEGPDLAIRSRVLIEDVDGDGVDEVLVIANEYGASRMVPGLGVSSGQLVSLIWDGSGLSEVWRSKKLDRGIADFALGDADNDGFDDLVVITTDTGPMPENKSRLYIYKIKS